MDTLKTRLLNLEKQVNELKTTVSSLQAMPLSKPIVNVVYPTEEFVVYDLTEELNTLKFYYTKREINGNKCYQYHLINVTDEIEQYVAPWGITLLSYTSDPLKIEEQDYEIIRDNQINPPLTHPLRNERLHKLVKDEIDKYFFSVVDENTRIFNEDITILFSNEYKELPHISSFITPFNKYHRISYTIKSLTTKNVVYTIRQDLKQDRNLNQNPTDLKLHLHIRGIPIEQNTDLLN